MPKKYQKGLKKKKQKRQSTLEGRDIKKREMRLKRRKLALNRRALKLLNREDDLVYRETKIGWLYFALSYLRLAECVCDMYLNK